jgi:hypothetical protein
VYLLKNPTLCLKKLNVMRTRLLFVLSFVTLSSIFSGCDVGEDTVAQKILSSGDIDTFAGVGGVGGHSGEGGLANEAQLSWVVGVAVDQAGNVYLADGATNTIHKVTISDGKIRTIAGTFIGFNTNNPTPFSGDGGLATSANIHFPQALTVDASGNVIIADAANMRIRYVTATNNIITTAAGTGNQGYSGDGDDATDAKIWNPYGVATDAAGNIYFADSQNNAIRKITLSTGVITTIAGLGPDNAGFSGDNGPATSAKLDMPLGIAIDSDGAIYIADNGNARVRKVSLNGTITTIAGTGATGYSGDGAAATSATFNSMKGIAVDVDKNVYICDAGNNVIRKITVANGNIQTIAGTGAKGFSGDGGPATEATLSNPWGVAVDATGNVFIADSDNSVVRVVLK